jgi:FlaA1/EpsC-like NDP-sugar epimerase/ADP-ribose pyrophosphatase YjhB (NUDIX family)
VISDTWGQLSIATHALNAVIWIFAYKVLGLHKDRLRFSSVASYLAIIKISLFSGLILAIESLMFTGGFDIILLLVYLLLSLNILIGLRVLARQLIRREANKRRENILVYGTSDIAIDLVNAMAFGQRYNVIGFVSDKPRSIGSLAGLPVIPLIDVEDFARVHGCKLVVLASNSLTPAHQTQVLMKLDKLGLSVSYAPTMDRAFDYEVKLKAVKPEDVLGRASETQFDSSVQADLNMKTVLVTGAGGSIGSEICRQILRYMPEKLVILELNELALYNLEQEISELLAKAELKTQFYYHLGSVTDETVLSRIFSEHKIDIVYHAAAYKHVPIVEDNVIAGVTNNVFGTKCVAELAHRFGANKFVLVSTDKAVRPTNVMGASKRLAELVIQDLSKSSETTFTMVRFGNVLGSSGSVIPKFKSQINVGGPITVTHEDITRYFMTIPEAAHLVLNAGAFASGGDVFLLDMGDPVKIVELAKSMVRQHGLQPVLASEIVGRKKLENEILIKFTGLRPGEKLFEELLVDGEAQETPNPKIFQSHDGTLKELDLAKALSILEKHIKAGQSHLVNRHLQELPLLYQPNSAAVIKPTDHENVYRAKTEISKASAEQNGSRNLVTHQEYPSLLKRFVSSKLGLALLHRYFIMTRGMTVGVRVLVQNFESEILVVKQSYVPGWHLPGGGVDHGEDVETAARREVYEETGISELTDLHFSCLKYNRTVSDRDHVAYFKARTNQALPTIRNPEISEIQFLSCDVASEIVAPEHKKYILENS